MTPGMYTKREYREGRNYVPKTLPNGVYIGFSLLNIGLTDLTTKI